MRFSDAPITDLSATIPASRRPIVPPDSGTPAPDRREAGTDGAGDNAKESAYSHEARTRAEQLIRDIGTEFSRLRKQNRSGAWADLEDKIAKSGDVMISSGMISSKDWVGMLIDIEQFRKAETGTAESPGDALAKWLSEGAEDKPKRKKAKEVAQ